jgi:hypothetical protein
MDDLLASKSGAIDTSSTILARRVLYERDAASLRD